MVDLKHLFVCIGALVLSAHLSAAPQANDPNAYAARFAVQAQPGSGLQRVTVPPAALAVLQTANQADLRIFNGAQQAVPLALTPQTQPAASPLPAQITLPAYPIVGTNPPAGGQLALRVEEAGGKRVIRVDSGSMPSTFAPQTVLGALIDTRAIAQPVVSLTLDADLPIAQPVPITVVASKDLKNWRMLVDATPVFRFAGAQAPAQNTLELVSPTILKDEYLRVSWPENLAVTLRGVRMQPGTTAKAAPAREPIALQLGEATAPLFEIVLRLPFATPLVALDIAPQTDNTLIPVRVLGRDDRAQPWRLLTSTVVYRLMLNGKLAVSAPVELYGSTPRELKIEADRASTGFVTTPRITALVEPVQLVFVASGAGPFTLAAGLPGAPSAMLPLTSLVPGYTAGQEATVPLAQVSGGTQNGAAPLVVPASAASAALPPTRTLVLWGALLGGVLLLGLLVWRLMRQLPAPAASTGEAAPPQ